MSTIDGRSRLTHFPISLGEANAFVVRHHRHHGRTTGHKFSLCAVFDGDVIGVAIVGRPVSRVRDDGLTLEVTRLCTDQVARIVTSRRGTQHSLGVCSFLYGASLRAALALGYKRLGTYILASESGVSLKAANWRVIGEVRGRSWSCKSRPRIDSHPLLDKLLIEAPV